MFQHKGGNFVAVNEVGLLMRPRGQISYLNSSKFYKSSSSDAIKKRSYEGLVVESTLQTSYKPF